MDLLTYHWLDDRKDIRAEKNFCRSSQRFSAITSRGRNRDEPANPPSPGKWPLKRWWGRWVWSITDGS